MSISHFSAMMSRMKYIDRWALMKNSVKENISEHSLEVAMIAHLLATIANVRFNKNVDASKAALIGMYHDSSEIITGDMPTPIKYYNSIITDAFKDIEERASRNLVDMLPEDIRSEYESIFFQTEEDSYEWKLVKGADKLSALIKCIEEEKSGNTEFCKAKLTIRSYINELNIEEVNVFIDEFLPSYEMTLDELK